MTSCRSANLNLTGDEGLSWFRSSATVTRGFCSRCGGNLFWKQEGDDLVYITAGSIDPPTGLSVGEHIFVGSKSDFYEIRDGRPQKFEW
jgi:hypothetical protein